MRLLVQTLSLTQEHRVNEQEFLLIFPHGWHKCTSMTKTQGRANDWMWGKCSKCLWYIRSVKKNPGSNEKSPKINNILYIWKILKNHTPVYTMWFMDEQETFCGYLPLLKYKMILIKSFRTINSQYKFFPIPLYARISIIKITPSMILN